MNVGGAVLFLISKGFEYLCKEKESTFAGLESIALFNVFLLKKKKKIHFYVKEILCVQFKGNDRDSQKRNMKKKLNHTGTRKQCVVEGTLLLYIILSPSE